MIETRKQTVQVKWKSPQLKKSTKSTSKSKQKTNLLQIIQYFYLQFVIVIITSKRFLNPVDNTLGVKRQFVGEICHTIEC